MASKLALKTIPLIRMDCPTCIPVLEREVKRLEGVTNVQGNYLNKTLKVIYDPDRVQIEEIEATIERVGYRIAYKKYSEPFSRLKDFLKGKKSDEVVSITDIDFPEKVLHASQPVAVLFSSPTCPTCYVFKKQFREIAEKVKGKATFYEMDIASTGIWRKYDVLSIPTVIIFKNGECSEKYEALPQKEAIARALEATRAS
ncbi:MAG: cation transporter [Candidatus Bathyarchaeota archaeon]|nr:MAG: cation transporter [Candidatus Bathyarchaeota archaeon]